MVMVGHMYLEIKPGASAYKACAQSIRLSLWFQGIFALKFLHGPQLVVFRGHTCLFQDHHDSGVRGHSWHWLEDRMQSLGFKSLSGCRDMQSLGLLPLCSLSNPRETFPVQVQCSAHFQLLTYLFVYFSIFSLLGLPGGSELNLMFQNNSYTSLMFSGTFICPLNI